MAPRAMGRMGSVGVVAERPARKEEESGKVEAGQTKGFLAWAGFKSAVQVGVSLTVLLFIYECGFFVPNGFVGNVWGVKTLQNLFIIQTLFELGDLVAELVMLFLENSRAHLPWDSIIHHSVSAAYSGYIAYLTPSLDNNFLALATVPLSCQLIGPLYTAHRLRAGFVHLPLLIIIVQVFWRLPLVSVSLCRAVQHFDVTPWPHFGIMGVLAWLDYKWLLWSTRLYSRRKGKTE